MQRMILLKETEPVGDLPSPVIVNRDVSKKTSIFGKLESGLLKGCQRVRHKRPVLVIDASSPAIN